MEPDGGMIEVNGTSRSHLQDGSWQKNLLYIPQHPYIFDDTLGNNIRFYHPSASAEDTARAAAAAGLAELVDSLPEGLEGRIGEGGRAMHFLASSSLSVAIAPALPHTPKFL